MPCILKTVPHHEKPSHSFLKNIIQYFDKWNVQGFYRHIKSNPWTNVSKWLVCVCFFFKVHSLLFQEYSSFCSTLVQQDKCIKTNHVHVMVKYTHPAIIFLYKKGKSSSKQQIGIKYSSQFAQQVKNLNNYMKNKHGDSSLVNCRQNIHYSVEIEQL